MLNFLICSWEKWNGNDEFFISREEKMMMVFLLYSWKKENVYEKFISIKEKKELTFFHVCDDDKTGEA